MVLKDIPGLVTQQFANLEIAIEIADIAIFYMVIFHSKLLVYEGNTHTCPESHAKKWSKHPNKWLGPRNE